MPGTAGKDEQLLVMSFTPEYREFGRGPKHEWKAVEDSDNFYDVYRKVEGIRERGISDDLLDDEWVKTWTEQLNLRGLGRFQNMRFADSEVARLPAAYKEAKNVADAARRIMKEDETAVFVAPKQVARQIEDHMSMMAGDARGEKQLKNFLKHWT